MRGGGAKSIAMKYLSFILALSVFCLAAHARGNCSAMAALGEHPARQTYTPVHLPTVISSNAVQFDTRESETKLKTMNVEFEVVEAPTYLWEVHGRQETKVVPFRPGEPLYFGKLLSVTKFPEPLPDATNATPALLHPRMQQYKCRLEEMGYQLVVDTSCSISGIGGYLSSSRKILALDADANWGIFLHEFQHAEFDYYLGAEFEALEKQVNSGRDITEVLPYEVRMLWGEKKCRLLENLIRKQLTRNSVNETLAVDAELNGLGFRRYLPRIGSEQKKYALQHQITDFQELAGEQPLTTVQLATLKNAKWQFHTITATDVTAPPAIAAAGTAVGLQILMAGWQWMGFPQLYFDDDWNVIGVKPDGTLVYLRLSHPAENRVK